MESKMMSDLALSRAVNDTLHGRLVTHKSVAENILKSLLDLGYIFKFKCVRTLKEFRESI